MKQFIHTHRKALVSGAVCLLLLLSLVGGGWAALSAPRQQPDAPEETSYPGLNIEQIGLRYDQQSQTKDSAAGDGSGDGQGQQDDTEAQDDTLPQETPKPDQIDQVEPDPGEEQPDQDKTDDENPGDGAADEDKKDQQPQGPQIATDLQNCTIFQDELKDDMFTFTAMAVGGDDDTYLQVYVNGKRVSASQNNYMTKLTLGRNEVTLLLRRGTKILGQITRVINYQAALANEDEPEKGNEKLNLRTSLDKDAVRVSDSEMRLETTNRNLTFTVWATDGSDNPIHQDHITVMLDGKEVKYSTGSGASGLEYNLHLEAGSIGSNTRHIVTVLVRDGKGNSKYMKYLIDYKTREKGEKIGTATVRLDLSVLGLGIIEAPVSTDIFQDVPASYAVKEVLESLGYDVSYTGTLDDGFYLSRISRNMTFEYAKIPEELKRLLELDGLVVTPPKMQVRFNSVGEFDYTREAGWMYCVNGAYPGRGMSEYFLSDGDTLTLRFTLAKGKDIGGSTGGNTGALQKYCGKWIDGSYIPNHTYKDGVCAVCGAVDPNHQHTETETVTKAATCTEPGEKTYTCSLCGESHTETIPAAGHHYENGVCTVCGQPDPDAKPEPTPDPDPGPDPEPDPGTDPEPTPDPNPGGEETQNETTA